MRVCTAILLLTISLFACQRQQESRVLLLPQGRQVALLYGMKAAQVLLHDPHYHYFERVSLTDLATQLKQPVSAFRSREDALAQYKEALQANIRRFTSEEAELLEGLLQQACRLIHHIDPEIFPRKLAIIKVSGRLMGPEVLYTRGQSLVIPQKVLKDYTDEDLLSYLVRGLYFIYIREHPRQQSELYALLHYKPLPHPQDSLVIPGPVRESISLNPNTGPLNYFLELEGAAESQRLYPLSSTNFHHFVIEDPVYAQRSFVVYALNPAEKGLWSLEADADGHSTLSFRDLINQIQERFPAQRVSLVHPDLSLADLFIRIVLAKPVPEELSPDYVANLTELQHQIRAIISSAESPSDKDPS